MADLKSNPRENSTRHGHRVHMGRKFGLLLVTLLLAFSYVAITPVPAFAHGYTAVLTLFRPSLNSNGNVVFKSQIRITNCDAVDCRVPKMKAWACAAAWDGNSYFQMGTCATNEKTFSQQTASNPQVTATKTLAGGCNPGVKYGTKGKGYTLDHNTLFYIPNNPAGSFLFGPASGGVGLC